MPLVKQEQTSSVQTNQRDIVRNLEGLMTSLQSADASVRRWAALDLGAYPEAAERLAKGVLVEKERSVREAYLLSLTRLGNTLAVNGLIQCLRSEDVALRNQAIDALKVMPEQIGPIMQSLLDDADPDVRIFSVNILESLKHPNVESWLIGVIEKDQHLNVCATAVDLLVEVGTKNSIEPLKKLKTRFVSEPYICFAADMALKRIQGQ